MDFGKLAKQAQDALAQGADKLEAAVKDNAGRIDGAVDKAGRFAKDKFPDRAAQIDNATGKAKGAVPRHEDGHADGAAPATGSAAPTAPSAAPVTPLPTHTAPDTTAPAYSPPGSAPSATPEVDRVAGAADPTPSSSGYAPPPVDRDRH